ncbi:Lon protease family protein [Bacillus taeanensis]|uniref:endopeptidase La n=1 Tax=Bacillus taeanensis TaxID=273032 RepID=A0A366XZM0_9BACI|nr:ATP-binding protein [Bacillus taeanensis]RBW71018.1 ATP-dependent protease [Bacillus taeanensis]
MHTHNDTDMKTKKRVELEKLRSICDPAIFLFETTEDVTKETEEIIGQKRAVEAVEFGLSVEQQGYNIFAAGPSGTGKTTFIQIKAAAFAKDKSTPNDWCYVYNFENPDRPLALSFPAGKGVEFQKDIANLLMEIKLELNRVFTDEEFNTKKRLLVQSLENNIDQKWKDVENYANTLNLGIEKSDTEIATFPIRNGKSLTDEEFNELDEVEKKNLKKKREKVQEKVNEILAEIQKVERNITRILNNLIKTILEESTTPFLSILKTKYKRNQSIIDYLESYGADIVERFSIFIKKQKANKDNLLESLLDEDAKLERYTVHIFVNNAGKEGAPVIYETNPTYQNLIGKIEYKNSLGSLVTSFKRIKPGALHLANGGYLILQASQLLRKPNSWEGLKQMLKTNCIIIENISEENSVIGKAGMKPESIPLNVKVILIGSPYYFELLSSLDEDFYKLFKVKAEFHAQMERNDEHIEKVVSFVKQFAEKEKLKPFHRSAVAVLVDYSSRLISDQYKLSTRFQDLTKVLVESSYWAVRENAEIVESQHIEKAIQKQTYRSNYIEERLRQLIIDGTLMVETDGEKIGQINGLSVMSTSEYRFGLPSKITVQTYAGGGGVTNIERETSLSGQIHTKGLLVLSGFLSGVFAKKRPIPLSASITFEQTYNMIDGDSASSTELYGLLSSLANVPIKQGIAVTGSVNQWGHIQAIGGVNEKIEGFYYVCKEKGLTGEQGVIIPQQNVKNLMLNQEVIEVIKDGKFHIWAVETIAEGIEILTGICAGHNRNEEGSFPDGTLFRKVEERINKMYETKKSQPKTRTLKPYKRR